MKLIFRLVSIAAFLGSIYLFVWGVQVSEWQPFAYFAILSTISVFAFILTHPAADH